MKRYELPTLYIKENNKIKSWRIWIKSHQNKITISKEYGFPNKLKQSYPEIRNTTFEKGKKLIQTIWNTQRRKGYHIQLTGKLNILPMKPYPLQDKYIKYPAYVQPKLNGVRCLLDLQTKIFYSMTKREYTFLKHIKDELKIYPNIYLDGELIIPNEDISILKSIVASASASNPDKIIYCVFDCIDISDLNMTFVERYGLLEKIIKNYRYIKIVPVTIVNNYQQIMNEFNKYVKQGYEGIIVRNIQGIYKLGKRSQNVLKSKNVRIKKFKIIGYKEGQRSEKGSVIWKLSCGKERYFWTKPMGTLEERKKLYKDADKYIGKYIYVKYLEIDKDGCVSHSPVALH